MSKFHQIIELSYSWPPTWYWVTCNRCLPDIYLLTSKITWNTFSVLTLSLFVTSKTNWWEFSYLLARNQEYMVIKLCTLTKGMGYFLTTVRWSSFSCFNIEVTVSTGAIRCFRTWLARAKPWPELHQTVLKWTGMLWVGPYHPASVLDLTNSLVAESEQISAARLQSIISTSTDDSCGSEVRV